jgi:hypothetical protein
MIFFIAKMDSFNCAIIYLQTTWWSMQPQHAAFEWDKIDCNIAIFINFNKRY